MHFATNKLYDDDDVDVDAFDMLMKRCVLCVQYLSICECGVCVCLQLCHEKRTPWFGDFAHCEQYGRQTSSKNNPFIHFRISSIHGAAYREHRIMNAYIMHLLGSIIKGRHTMGMYFVCVKFTSCVCWCWWTNLKAMKQQSNKPTEKKTYFVLQLLSWFMWLLWWIYYVPYCRLI